MKKSDLAERQRMMAATQTDSDEDFEEIIVSSRVPVTDKDKIVLLPLIKTVEYTDENFESITGRPQPFKAYGDERLDSLAKSIAEHGVIDPITVRPLPDGTYQVLAGRHRRRASLQNGMTTIPAIIRADIDDYQAAMIMLDTNLERRPDLSYSEKAYAYRMRMELHGSRGKRTDLDGSERRDSLADAGRENKDSRRTVAYLIRLTYLHRDLMEMVDNGTIGFKVGVAMSYLTPATQELLLTEILSLGIKVHGSQIDRLRDMETTGVITADSMREVFKQPSKPKPLSVTINSPKLREYADLITDNREWERLFLEFLGQYRQRLNTGT